MSVFPVSSIIFCLILLGVYMWGRLCPFHELIIFHYEVFPLVPSHTPHPETHFVSCWRGHSSFLLMSVCMIYFHPCTYESLQYEFNFIFKLSSYRWNVVGSFFFKCESLWLGSLLIKMCRPCRPGRVRVIINVFRFKFTCCLFSTWLHVSYCFFVPLSCFLRIIEQFSKFSFHLH